MSYQALMFALTFMNYAVLHATRSVWSAATKDIKDLYKGQISEDDIAGVNSAFLACYGIGGFFTGQLADKYRKRGLIFVLYSMITLSVTCLGLLSLVPVEQQRSWLPVYYLLKIFNGTCQSCGWAINLVIMSNWFPRIGRGLLIGVWGCNTSVGDVIGQQVYKIVAADKNHWGHALWIVAGLVFTMGGLTLILLVEEPKDVGLDLVDDKINVIERNKEDPTTDINKTSVITSSTGACQVSSCENPRKKIRFWDAFKIPGILEFSVSMFFGKLVMNAMFYWNQHYFQEELKYEKPTAIDLTSWFEFGTFFGNILLGLGSDLLPMRSPLFLFATAVGSLFIVLLASMQATDQGGSMVWLATDLAIIGANLIGSSIIIAAIECDMGNYVRQTQNVDSLGTFAGIVDGIASLGSTLS